MTAVNTLQGYNFTGTPRFTASGALSRLSRTARNVKRVLTSDTIKGMATGAAVMAGARYAANLVATTDAGITAGFCGAAAGGHTYYKSYKERCAKALENGEDQPAFIFRGEALKRDGLRAVFRKANYDTDGLKMAALKAGKTFLTTGLGGVLFQGAADYFENLPAEQLGLFESFAAKIKEFFAPILNLFGLGEAKEAVTSINLSENEFISGETGNDTLVGALNDDIIASEVVATPVPTDLSELISALKDIDGLDAKTQEALEFAQRDNPPAWAINNLGVAVYQNKIPGGEALGISLLKQAADMGNDYAIRDLKIIEPDWAPQSNIADVAPIEVEQPKVSQQPGDTFRKVADCEVTDVHFKFQDTPDMTVACRPANGVDEIPAALLPGDSIDVARGDGTVVELRNTGKHGHGINEFVAQGLPSYPKIIAPGIAEAMNAANDTAIAAASEGITNVLASLDPSEFSGQARDIIEGALRGNPQDIYDAGAGMLRGAYGFEQSPAQGLALIEEALKLGHKQAEDNIAWARAVAPRFEAQIGTLAAANDPVVVQTPQKIASAGPGFTLDGVY